MTDVVTPFPDLQRRPRFSVTPEAQRARIASRYRTEARFRAAGLIAIAVAATFLIVLLSDIVGRAVPAFMESRLNLAATVAAGKVDPAKPDTGDYQSMVRDGLRALFPAVTSRNDKKALDSLLSSDAGNAIRTLVKLDPSKIGSAVTVPVVLSSDADLYLKGLTSKSTVKTGTAAVTPSAQTGPITLTAATGAFTDELAQVTELSKENVAVLTRSADRLALLAQSAAADVKAAATRRDAAKATNDAAALAKAEVQVATKTAERQKFDDEAARTRDKIAALKSLITGNNQKISLDTSMPSLLIAVNGGVIKVTSLSDSQADGEVVVPLTSAGETAAGSWRLITLQTPETSRKITDRQVAFLEKIKETGAVVSSFNWPFFTNGDSREPELAGIMGALTGSALTMLVTLLLCLPIGVGAAVYLEEFAPKNRITDLIEVNINNLAAVPSIVFGLLGLAIFLNFFGMPRSSPLVGGLVLALLVLPTIIIASRAALKAVPPSIREAALGVGASHQQAVFHHVLPLAVPGILTGTIIGMAHALGETAPLLMIGMIAFIVDVPSRVTDAATVLPVQIFLWSDLPELGFQAKTAAAILVMLAFLFAMNGLAIWLRRKFERRW